MSYSLYSFFKMQSTANKCINADQFYKTLCLKQKIHNLAKLMSEIIELLEYKFINVGVFYLAETPWCDKNGENCVRASLKLNSEEYRKADETAYLIYSNDILKYVGEYTYNLSDRWLSGDYVNHHKSDLIEQEIESGKKVTLWLAISPFCNINKTTRINISKSIEHEILRQHDAEWNKRNKINKWEKWRSNNCVSVEDIVREIENIKS